MPVGVAVQRRELSDDPRGLNRAFVDELASFRSGSHDDTTDAPSDSFAVVSNASKAAQETMRLVHEHLMATDESYRWRYQRLERMCNIWAQVISRVMMVVLGLEVMWLVSLLFWRPYVAEG
jgi:hypothetical protein